MSKLLDYCCISGKAVTSFPGEKKYIATGDIINNQIVSYEQVTFENKPSRANQIVNIGDLLFAKMKDTKKVLCITDKNDENIYSTGFYVLSPKETIRSKYLYWYLNSKKFNLQKDKLSVGATMKGLNNDGLKKIEINEVPNLQEQDKIADKIDKIQEAIENRKKVLEDMDKLIRIKYDEFVKKYFLENREISTLIEKTSNIKMQDTEINYIDISSINNKTHRITATTKFNLKDAPSRARQILKKKDILFSGVRPNLKNVAMVEMDIENLIGSTGFIVLRANKEILPEFLYIYLLSDKFTNKMVRKTVGASYPAISKNDVISEKIKYISIENQSKIVSWIKKMEHQKDNLMSDINDLEQLKNSFLDKYFK